MHARTEGWIARLHLAALSLQDREDVAGFIAAFSGSQQHLAQDLDLVGRALTTDADTIMRGYLAFARLQQACGQGNRACETLEAFTLLCQVLPTGPLQQRQQTQGQREQVNEPSMR